MLLLGAANQVVVHHPATSAAVAEVEMEGFNIRCLIAILLAILAPIFAQLIYFAVSRNVNTRDASSALYTRYPEGLASALEKLSRSERR